MFQYGDLHFGQTFGSSSPLFTHSWPHLSHLKPSSFTLAILIAYTVEYIIFTLLSLSIYAHYIL